MSPNLARHRLDTALHLCNASLLRKPQHILVIAPMSMQAIPTVPPPTYELEDEHGLGQSSAAPEFPTEAQLLISPTGTTSQFQKGYLGAAGERAAIEGEIQIKGVPVASWNSLCVFAPLRPTFIPR